MASLTDWYLAMWLPTTSSGFLKVITSGFDFLPGATSKPSMVKPSRSILICASSKWPMPSKRPLRLSSPSIATRAKARARVIRSVSSLTPAMRPVEAGDQRFQRILRGVEQEVGLRDIVRRLALAVDQLQQIGRKAERRNISRCRQQFLEGRGFVALQRRARIFGLQRFEVAAAAQTRRRRRAPPTGRGGRGTAACAGRSTSADRRGGSPPPSSPARPRGYGAPSRSTPSTRSAGRCRQAPCRTGRRNPPAPRRA